MTELLVVDDHNLVCTFDELGVMLLLQVTTVSNYFSDFFLVGDWIKLLATEKVVQFLACRRSAGSENISFDVGVSGGGSSSICPCIQRRLMITDT